MLFMGIIRDITAQTAQNRPSKMNEQDLKRFLTNPIRHYLSTTKRIHSGCKIQGTGNFGRTIDGLRVRHLFAQLHPKSIMMDAPVWDPEYGESRAFSTEMCNHTTNEVFPVEIQAQKIRFGEEWLIVSAVHDATRIKRLTEHLHRSERMELLGRLAGGFPTISTTCCLSLSTMHMSYALSPK